MAQQRSIKDICVTAIKNARAALPGPSRDEFSQEEAKEDGANRFRLSKDGIELEVVCDDEGILYALGLDGDFFGVSYVSYEDVENEHRSSLSGRVKSDFVELFRSAAQVVPVRPRDSRMARFLTEVAWLSPRQVAPVALFYDPVAHAGGMTYLWPFVDEKFSDKESPVVASVEFVSGDERPAGPDRRSRVVLLDEICGVDNTDEALCRLKETMKEV